MTQVEGTWPKLRYQCTQRCAEELGALLTTLKKSCRRDPARPHAPTSAANWDSSQRQSALEQMISPTAPTSIPIEDEATRAAQFAQEKLKAEGTQEATSA